MQRSRSQNCDRKRTSGWSNYRAETIPLTRQPFPLASDSLVGHCSRGSGGVASGGGLTNRAEISPPPVIHTVLSTGS